MGLVLIAIPDKQHPPNRESALESRLFSVSHSIEFQLFFSSLFPTPSSYKFQTFKGETMDCRIVTMQIMNFRLYCYIFCKMSGFPNLFYTDLIWNFRKLSSLALEFQMFLRPQKTPSIGLGVVTFYLE